MYCRFVLIFYVVLFAGANAKDTGEKCTKDGVEGVCMMFEECRSALDAYEKLMIPQICDSDSPDIVCCVEESNVTEKSSDKVDESIEEASLVPTGRKALDKCMEYHRNVGSDWCERQEASRVKRSEDYLTSHIIVGGEQSESGEFPHMVLLGYGNDVKSATWQCGGTLISDKFILTAGHCTYNRDGGAVTFARVGLQNRSEPIIPFLLYKISRIIKHPEYKPPHRYNDIALLETEESIHIDVFALPACIHTGDDVNEDEAIATGWGKDGKLGKTLDTLQKVVLKKFSNEECKAAFPEARLLKQGYQESIQSCYGDKEQSKDTCQGDSGGPLQLKNADHCMFNIIGVTSYGRTCGYVGEPGMYTRVSAYADWIESIVWP